MGAAGGPLPTDTQPWGQGRPCPSCAKPHGNGWGPVVRGLFFLVVGSRLLRKRSLSLCFRYFRVACELRFCRAGSRPGELFPLHVLLGYSGVSWGQGQRGQPFGPAAPLFLGLPLCQCRLPGMDLVPGMGQWGWRGSRHGKKQDRNLHLGTGRGWAQSPSSVGHAGLQKQREKAGEVLPSLPRPALETPAVSPEQEDKLGVLDWSHHGDCRLWGSWAGEECPGGLGAEPSPHPHP